ncbi:hypothetical protein J1N35_029192 [Gossypium stocksii]|uniref:DUF4283 domain-containing protein n=1 Tax=Gossypium stocksii TaxID=47602 RepID=A0A9D3UXU0_9ROSI|nr:hypothetical protein J1N35_029192 [Gossypium stocksii]
MGANDVGSYSGVGRATKKVRRRPDMPPDVEDPMVDGNGQKVQSPKTLKASCKSTLMGSATIPMLTDNFEENFELLDGDVMTDVSLRCSFQLMDLENDFFLVRFLDHDDYHKVLTGGSWVIYGQHLTVKPWSLDFSTSQNEVDIQVVWLRLPGLPEELCLTQKVHSSESESGRSIPVVEEVSLQHQVEEEPFGLWMLVECRQRGRTRNMGATEKAVNSNSFGGSRVATITEDLGIMGSEIRTQIDGEKNGDIEAMKKELEIVGASSGLIAKDNTMGKNMVSIGKNKGLIISSGVKSEEPKVAGGNPHVQMGSRIWKPNNSNVGSFTYVGPNVSVDNVTMSQNDVSGRNGSTSFKIVIVHSNLDKGKHKAV